VGLSLNDLWILAELIDKPRPEQTDDAQLAQFRRNVTETLKETLDVKSSISPETWKFSERSGRLTSSAIRELLKVTERPEVISFAGGLPSPLAFPVEPIREVVDEILREFATEVLQYNTTEGYAPLREWIAEQHSTGSTKIDPARILITTGSQQALDLVGKVLVDPGSRILLETPTYLGAMQAFSLCEPEYLSLPCDDSGLRPDLFEPQMLNRARLMYIQPDFQNPTGRQLPLERRQAIADLATRSSWPIVEDSPYSKLSYGKAPLPSVFSMAPDHIVHLGSFSKVLAPGLRVGYAISPEPLYRKMLQAKQATDLHSTPITQHIVYRLVSSGFLEHHMEKVCALYGAQREAMLLALREYMPDGVNWNRPEGGMFVWLQLPNGIDSGKLLQDALDNQVAFVPGAPFFATNADSPEAASSLRLSFVTVPPEKITEGVERLAKVIRRAQQNP
jgi:2-aminoadipate transaminase